MGKKRTPSAKIEPLDATALHLAYLLLEHDTNRQNVGVDVQSQLKIRLVESLPQIVDTWDSSTRLSPIYIAANTKSQPPLTREFLG